MPSYQQKSYRSFFWPVILLGTGVIWLLANLGIIPTENLWILLQLWPVLIIVIGLDVIFARRLPLVGAVLALAVVGGVVYILLEGEDLVLTERPEPRTESFVVAAEETNAASFDLNLSTQPAFVGALTGSNNLIEAEIGHYGDVDLWVSSGAQKEIALDRRGMISWFAWLFQDMQEAELTWDIRLSREIPFDLDVNGSAGSAELDLSGIQLEAFFLDGSMGHSTIVFPASRQGYEARVEASTGNIKVILPAEGNLTLRLDGSTGQITLDTPEGAALQVEVLRGGTGDVVTPSWLMKVEGREERDEGVYQTEGFDSADYQLVVVMEDLSTGNLVIE
jgi:hypothetical protein